MRIGIFLALALATTPALAVDVPAPTGPLTPEQKALFEGVAEDAPPEKLNAVREDLEGRHYLTCDENWIDKWEPRFRDLGGIYTGVGTDQAYVFIGWMKPTLTYFTDYFPWVGRVHQIYAVAFAESETIDDFIKWWDPKEKKATDPSTTAPKASKTASKPAAKSRASKAPAKSPASASKKPASKSADATKPPSKKATKKK